MDTVKRKPMGGTELAVESLKRHCGPILDSISLGINCLPRNMDLPVAVWFQHDYNQPGVQWLRDRRAVAAVDKFVFVSHWQRERFQLAFSLPEHKCMVIRNAVDWEEKTRTTFSRRYVYSSTPFRGLDVLLEAWRLANMPEDAELHVFSSMAIYGQDEGPYEELYARARELPGVTYHGFQPNRVVREMLWKADFLAYPSTFEETSCIAVIEALSSGCKVICPSYGALPETGSGFADVYPWVEDRSTHAEVFAHKLRTTDYYINHLQRPYMRAFYSWETRGDDWRALVDQLNA